MVVVGKDLIVEVRVGGCRRYGSEGDTIPEFQRTHYASCSDEFSILKSFSRNCLKTIGDDVLSEIREG